MNKDELKTKKDFALYYQSIGLNIIPVGANKIALIKWENYQNKCSTVEEINRWWEQWPDANIAVVTGKKSGIVALDLDLKHGRTSKEFQIPPTACAKSGSGGEHFFFKYPINSDIKSGSAISGLGVDIRADGGYLLLSPSTNEAGGLYEWIVALESKNDLAEMPEWLKTITIINFNDKKWLFGKDGVSEGLRNETSASMAGKILSSTDSELWESLGWEQLKIWNQKCSPPMMEKELRNTWKSIKKRHTENGQTQWKNILKEKNKKGKAITRCFTDIQSVPISWLWEGRIALGKLTMIVGDPGLGKSLVTTTLATNVSMGYPWPVDQSKPPIGDVIFISAEDDPADTIKPRLEASEADCTRIHIVEAIQDEDAENGSTERMFSFERDIKTLENLLSEFPNCKLVIIDPISAYLGSADSNKNSDIRGLLAPLSKLAEKYKTAIVLISHLNKNTGENVLYRTTGSLAFIAAVRTAYIVTKDKNNPQRRLLMPLKSNISKEKTGLAYSIMEAENNAPVIAWEKKAVEMTAEEALAPSESKEEHTATNEAKDFLLRILVNGAMKVNDVEKEARQAGINKKPLRSAREKLGIKSKKSTTFKDGFWEWSLPEDALKGEEALSERGGILDNRGHLGDNPNLDDFADHMNPDRKKDKDGIDDIPLILPKPIPPEKLPF